MIMSFLFKMSRFQSKEQSRQLTCLKNDEFPDERIHSQLVNFHNTKHFRFQSYMVIMFLFFNEENMQLPEMILTAEINNDFFKYMNILMAEV